MYTIFYNPRCSKSRQTLALLRQQGIEPTIIEYLKTPPSVSELRRIISALGIQPIDLVRRKESRFKELGLDVEIPENNRLLKILAENPILLERPIVLKGSAAVIARPPGAVEILF